MLFSDIYLFVFVYGGNCGVFLGLLFGFCFGGYGGGLLFGFCFGSFVLLFYFV